MKLQNILFPGIETAPEEKLYFRRDEHNTKYILPENKITFADNAKVSFDTYYNSFSLGKWSKYTILGNLFLMLDIEGRFSLRISVCSYLKSEVITENILNREIECEKRSTVSVSIPTLDYNGSIIFTLTSCRDDAVFYGGYYGTEISSEKLNPVRIAIGICTFKREEFIARNLELLKKEFIENRESPLFGKLEVYVSDNGKTLNCDILNTDSIHVFPNKNLGGSGGFGRCIYEICQDKENKGYSHILLMDDDVIISPESIYRTYTFLQLLKDEYQEAFLGGAMLRLDKRYIQSEAADYNSMMGHKPIKYKYDLRRLDFVLKNEIEEKVNFFGWWYCVMPITVVNGNNLPLPLFIKYDDKDYGLRNGKTFITLNGISVWHEPFENKRIGFLEYYYFRNICILNAIHYPQYGKKEIKKQLLKKCVKYCLQFRYKDALLCIRGVEDFLQGIDHFKTVNAEKLHKQVMGETYESRKVEEMNFDFSQEEYEENIHPQKESKLHKYLRYITFNGYVLPAKKTVLLPAVNTPTNRLYRVRKAIYFEEVSGKAFATKRNWGEGFGVLENYLDCCKLIDCRYDIVKMEYSSRYKELTNIEFWKKYLFSEPNENTTEDSLEGKERLAGWGIKKIFAAYICWPGIKICRGCQHLISNFISVKKNRITIYCPNRKGYSCSPKYVVEKLLELVPGKYEIVWISQYPETCGELEKKGIKVIKEGTLRHFWVHFTAKILISNDNLNRLYIKRSDQLYINTWHGVNYKKIGYDGLIFQNKIQKIYFRMKNPQPDIYLSGSEFFTHDVAKSFKFDESIFVPTGLPRNDLFFKQDIDLTGVIRNKINIPCECRILLYAPTFRHRSAANDFGIDYEGIVNYLEKKYNEKWMVLYRAHYFAKGEIENLDKKAIDVSQYEDMQELLYISDILISDYSSCMWDFCLMGKPCFVFATDMDQYILKDRSFAYPPSKWPYMIASNNQELLDNMANFNEEKYQERLAQHYADAGSYEKGTASQAVVKIIEDYCEV